MHHPNNLPYYPPHRLDLTVQNIKAETPSANLRTLVIDLASLDSVRKAAAEVNAYSEPIHVRLLLPTSAA